MATSQYLHIPLYGYNTVVRTIDREYLRSIIFGIEDSLVSTTGLLVGLGVGADDKRIVILGGTVAIAIEAVSMGAGEYLSDSAVQELDKLKRHRDNPLVSGSLMMIAYLLAGLIPLLPVIFLSFPCSLYYSVGFALAGLFLLGYTKGKVLHTSPLRGALKILIVGGLATFLGVLVGALFQI